MTTNPDGTTGNQPGGESNDIRQMRDAINRKDQKISELTEQLGVFRSAALAGVAHQAGFSPKSGPVKLVMERFEADLTPDKLTPEAFTEFAKEWDLEPSGTGTTDTTTTPPASTDPTQQQAPGQPQVPTHGHPQPDPVQQQVQQVNQFQQPADQLQAAAMAAQSNLLTGQPSNPQEMQAAIQQAEAAGDWNTSLALKLGQVPAAPDGASAHAPNGALPTHTPSDATT